MWAFRAEVVDADFECIEVVIDGSTEAAVIGWDLMRSGVVKIRQAGSPSFEQGPPQHVHHALHDLLSQSFGCRCCADDLRDIIHTCSAMQKVLADVATSLSSVQVATEYALKLREQLLVWASESASVELPLSHVGYTHDYISNRFRHGQQDPDVCPVGRGPGGRGIETLVADLISGKSDLLRDTDLELEVVFYHGRHRSLNNRRLWAFKQYSEHCDHDVNVKARIIALLPEARLKNGRFALPKFFEANQSENNGDAVRFRGTPPPLVRSRRRVVRSTAAEVAVKSEVEHHSWTTLLDGSWVDESGEEVAVVKDGLMKCVFSRQQIPLKIERRPWPISCEVAGELWDGSILEGGDHIVWQSGHHWWRKAATSPSSDHDARFIMIRISAGTIRDFGIGTTELLIRLQERLVLRSDIDFSSRIMHKEKCLLMAFTVTEQAALALKFLGSIDIGHGVHAESVDFGDLSHDALTKVESLRAFVQRGGCP